MTTSPKKPHSPCWKLIARRRLQQSARVLAQNSDKKGGREKSLHKYTRSASLAGLSRALQTLEKRRNYRRAQTAKTPHHDVPNSVLGAGSAGSGTMPASTVLALAA